MNHFNYLNESVLRLDASFTQSKSNFLLNVISPEGPCASQDSCIQKADWAVTLPPLSFDLLYCETTKSL